MGNDKSLRLRLQVSEKNNSVIVIGFYNALETSDLSIIVVNIIEYVLMKQVN